MKFKIGDVVKRGDAIGVIVEKGFVWDWRVSGDGWDGYGQWETGLFSASSRAVVDSNKLTPATRSEALAFQRKYPKAKCNIPKPRKVKPKKKKAVK